MVDPTLIDARSAQLDDLLLASEDLTDFLQQFVSTAARNLAEDAEDLWCSITLLRGAGAATVATSHERAAALDEVQYAFDGGPCLSAADQHRVVLLADTRTDRHWPPYSRAAAQHGIRSVLAVPFELDDEARAALNVYSATVRQFDARTTQVIEREVALASRALRLALRLARQRETQLDMAAAMASRATIDMAIGIVMARQACTQDDAVALLTAASNHRNVKLRDVAAELVAAANGGSPSTHFNPSVPPAARTRTAPSPADGATA